MRLCYSVHLCASVGKVDIASVCISALATRSLGLPVSVRLWRPSCTQACACPGAPRACRMRISNLPRARVQYMHETSEDSATAVHRWPPGNVDISFDVSFSRNGGLRALGSATHAPRARAPWPHQRSPRCCSDSGQACSSRQIQQHTGSRIYAPT